jgi:hypothetical protein
MGKKRDNSMQTETTETQDETNGALQTHASAEPETPPTAQPEKQKRPRKPKLFMIITQQAGTGATVEEIEGEDEAFTKYATLKQNGEDVTCYQVEKVELLLSAKRAG